MPVPGRGRRAAAPAEWLDWLSELKEEPPFWLELELELELEAEDEPPPEWREPASDPEELPPVLGTARSSPWPNEVAAANRTKGTIPMSLTVFMASKTSRKARSKESKPTPD